MSDWRHAGAPRPSKWPELASRGRDTHYGLRTRARGCGGLSGVVAAAILVGWRVSAPLEEEGEGVGQDFLSEAVESGPGPPELGTPGRRAWTPGLRREDGSSASPVLLLTQSPPAPTVVAPRCVSGKGLGKWGGGALKSGVGNSRAFRFSQESQSPILNASVGHDQFVNLWGYG